MIEEEVEALKRIKRFHEEPKTRVLGVRPIYIFGVKGKGAWTNLYHAMAARHLMGSIWMIKKELVKNLEIESTPVRPLVAAGVAPVLDSSGGQFQDWKWFRYNTDDIVLPLKFAMVNPSARNYIQIYGNIFENDYV